MSKQKKPLAIGIIPPGEWVTDELRTVLHAQGHTLERLDGMLPTSFDVIIGPTCWRIDPRLGHLEGQLQCMIKGVQNQKYPKIKEK